MWMALPRMINWNETSRDPLNKLFWIFDEISPKIASDCALMKLFLNFTEHMLIAYELINLRQNTFYGKIQFYAQGCTLNKRDVNLILKWVTWRQCTFCWYKTITLR